ASRDVLSIDSHHDTLIAEFLSRLFNEDSIADRRRIDRHLVGARAEQRANVIDRAHAAADRQRHKTSLRGALHDVENNAAAFVTPRDIEKTKLVCTRGVIRYGGFDRIAGVPQIDEVDAFDDAAVLHIEAWDDPDFKHQTLSNMDVRHTARPLRISRSA